LWNVFGSLEAAFVSHTLWEQEDEVEVDHKEEHKEEEKLRSVSVLLSLLL